MDVPIQEARATVRRKHAFLLLACLIAGLAAPRDALTQDPGLQPYYWPHRTVGIPVGVDVIAKFKDKPSDLQLYYRTNGAGAFQRGPKLPLGGLQQLDGEKKGFLFTADRDGDYEFTVQFLYPDNTTNPPTDQLTPQQRVIIDTIPPQIQIVAGSNGVAWRVTDDNLDPRGIILQCRWPGQQQWTTVTERPFQARDQFTWTVPAGKVLEVRVQARDRAGHEAVSQIARVPPDAASSVALPKTGSAAVDWIPPAGSLPQARYDYVNSLDFDVDYTIEKMGRSGVRAAHLFVQKKQGNWEFVKKFDVRLMPSDKDHTISIPYSAKDEGIYGFIVIPESGAGTRASDPKKDDPPMINVVVDKTAPYIRITNVQVRPGGTRGPVVEINWEAADPNLMPDPISLEWSLDPKATKWNEVKYRLKNTAGQNTGRYVWEVPDENLWKFYLRARAVDRAANTGEYIWSQKDADGKEKPVEVIIDLELPSGSINRIRNGATPRPSPPSTPSPPARSSDAPPTIPSGSGTPAGGGPALPPLPGSGSLPEVPKLP
jgi:hypothetical protein